MTSFHQLTFSPSQVASISPVWRGSATSAHDPDGAVLPSWPLPVVAAGPDKGEVSAAGTARTRGASCTLLPGASGPKVAHPERIAASRKVQPYCATRATLIAGNAPAKR